ncbi:MAG: tRNA (adenosine(37)-N6)-dimethylallyltransferase MiaA [Tepidisphaera sp.]
MTLAKPTARFPVIVGPTAGGKSALAVAVAHELAKLGRFAEIVTADSIQIYRGLDIGSAKPTLAERAGVPHHLIDLVDPDGPPFTVAHWLREAERVIADIQARGGVPIVVGGTHLYVKAFLDGMFEGPGTDEALREELRARGLPALREELERVDPAAAARIHPNDERRTVRALEVFRLTGAAISSRQEQWDKGRPSREDCVLIGLDWPSELINPRINQRVRDMVTLGLVEEVRSLHTAGRLGSQAREALGYKQILAHLQGRCSLTEAIEKVKIETRRFGKNQRTWLKRLRTTPGSVWIDANETPADGWPLIVLQAIGLS